MGKALASANVLTDMTSTQLNTQAKDFCAEWQGNFLSVDAVAALRKTDLLSHMADTGKRPHEIYRASFDLLHTMGSVDLATAVGLTMHQYTLGTIATVQISDEESRQKRDQFLKVIREEKLLCAVSSFDMTFRSDGTIKAGLNATMADGQWIVSGHKRYQSMASVADSCADKAAKRYQQAADRLGWKLIVFALFLQAALAGGGWFFAMRTMPSQNEIDGRRALVGQLSEQAAQRRGEVAELERQLANQKRKLADIDKRGARIEWSMCQDSEQHNHLCFRTDESERPGQETERTYRIPWGY